MRNYGLPKASEAFVRGEQIPMIQNQHALNQLQGILAVQGALEQRGLAQEKRRDLAEFEASLPPVERLRFRVDPAGYLKNMRPDPQRQATLQLAGLLSSGGYQAPAGTPATDGAAGPADMVAPNDAAAIEALRNATGPMRVNVPNPRNVQALAVMAEPDKAIPEILRQQRAPATAKPLANIRPVTGGYVRQLPDGSEEFVRTQPEAQPRPEPAPSFIIKQDPNSPTGWSHQNTRTGEMSTGAPPPSGGGREHQDMIRRVMQFGQLMEKTGIPQSMAVMDEAVKNVTPETAKYLTGAAAYIPDAAMDKPVKDARQALQRLFNITLKDRSGAAVTIPEFERLKKEFGTGLWNTPDQVITGIERAKAILDKHYASVAAGFPKEVRDTYFTELRGSESFSGSPAPASAPSPAPAQRRVIRTGTFNGRKIRQFEDGSMEYIQ